MCVPPQTSTPHIVTTSTNVPAAWDKRLLPSTSLSTYCRHLTQRSSRKSLQGRDKCVMESKQDAHGLPRPASSSSMVISLCETRADHQASMRPTSNVFATPELPTTPKKKKTLYGDRDISSLTGNNCRFIPNREGVDLQASFSLLESPTTSPSKPRRRHNAREIDAQRGTSAFYQV